ncbi:MAG: FkbM family methyltransferase [Actinomycetia bacterium]|nr:FkbM family methyltransferase [Actinomycetes bacterium]
MDHQDYLDWTYFGDGGLDKDEFERLQRLFSGVDVFVDVGASHGVYTYHALQHMRGGTIISVEADPERFGILEENARQWSKGSGIEVRCIMAAVSDHEDAGNGETMTFYTTGTQISGGLFPVEERSDEYEPIEVSIVTLDDIVPDEGRVLVKIDVEGGELRVLRGARKLIESGRASFFVELSWWGDRDRGTSVLSTLGFVRRSGLGIERRLRSDYLLTTEPDKTQRWMQQLKVLPPLLPRYVFGKVTPYSVRRKLIRRQNQKRLAKAPRNYSRSEPRD